MFLSRRVRRVENEMMFYTFIRLAIMFYTFIRLGKGSTVSLFRNYETAPGNVQFRNYYKITIMKRKHYVPFSLNCWVVYMFGLHYTA